MFNARLASYKTGSYTMKSLTFLVKYYWDSGTCPERIGNISVMAGKQLSTISSRGGLHPICI